MTDLRCRKTDTLKDDKEVEQGQNDPELQAKGKLSQASCLLRELQLASSAETC